tara:strand:+ start:540 stop:824 length:285 start_codon:yes stop_codon:yes gene_type:complete
VGCEGPDPEPDPDPEPEAGGDPEPEGSEAEAEPEEDTVSQSSDAGLEESSDVLYHHTAVPPATLRIDMDTNNTIPMTKTIIILLLLFFIIYKFV